MSAPQLSPQALQRVRAEQVRILYANGGFPLLATLVAGVLLAGALLWERAVSPVVIGVWLGVMVTQMIARWGVRAIYLRRTPPEADWARWAWIHAAGVMVGALNWGVGSLWLLPPGRVDLQLLVILVLSAISYASLATFGSFVAIFYALFLTTLLPSIVWSALQGDALHLVYAALAVLWMPAVAVLAGRYSRTLTQAITLQHAFAEQKAIAEDASLAKSRFLASASHDLRQPVHALGMFLGALRGHKLPARSREVIDSMDASIGALDGLFTSLLDISKLDAGVTETKVVAMPLQPLLARICRELQPEAAAKGLTLTCVPTSVAVHSDPMLLERILRNLVGNAIRYTERGGVLMGARRDAGVIRLEVWDSGRGIAPEHRAAVFEEFYQVSNPDRDRAKGLGLGLAIVRRLAALLDHPLTLRSAPDRGSVFGVSMPRAEAAESPAPGETVLASLRTGLILAIDDETTVRAAMTQLLTGDRKSVV